MDERKNQAGESERTSILPQADDLGADRTESCLRARPQRDGADASRARRSGLQHRAPTEESVQGVSRRCGATARRRRGKPPGSNGPGGGGCCCSPVRGLGAGMITHASIVGD